MVKNQTNAARVEAARYRAKIYDLLLRVFASLPENALIQELRDDSFKDFLDTCYALGNVKIKCGIEHIKSYCSSIESRTSEEILNELSVDRTRLLRGTGDRNLKPPYESLYKTDKNSAGTALAVKNFYRKAGLLPDENICEMLDYLGVELDFMYQLCLREVEQWSSGKDASATLTDEEEFLQEHLGSWVGEYCAQAEKHAWTTFYRGFLAVLDAFISLEIEYLHLIRLFFPSTKPLVIR